MRITKSIGIFVVAAMPNIAIGQDSVIGSLTIAPPTVSCPGSSVTQPPCTTEGEIDVTSSSETIVYNSQIRKYFVSGEYAGTYDGHLTTPVNVNGNYVDIDGLFDFNAGGRFEQDVPDLPSQYGDVVKYSRFDVNGASIRSVAGQLETPVLGASGIGRFMEVVRGAPVSNGQVATQGYYSSFRNNGLSFGLLGGYGQFANGAFTFVQSSQIETTRLNHEGLMTPRISVSQGINMNGSVLSNLADGVAPQDAVTRRQLDAALATLGSDTPALAMEAAARTQADAALTSAIVSESATRALNDAALSDAIGNETMARAQADNALATAIDAESATRAVADNALSTAIGNETAARMQTDTALSTAIGIETTSRNQANTQINQRIDNERDAREALTEAVTSETNARMTADVQLGSRIDAISDRMDGFENRLDRVEAHVSSSTAVAVAMGGATFLPDMKFNMTANVATYGGAHAGAMQVGAIINPHVAVNAGVATGFNKRGKTAARAGFTIGW